MPERYQLTNKTSQEFDRGRVVPFRSLVPNNRRCDRTGQPQKGATERSTEGGSMQIPTSRSISPTVRPNRCGHRVVGSTMAREPEGSTSTGR